MAFFSGGDTHIFRTATATPARVPVRKDMKKSEVDMNAVVIN